MINNKILAWLLMSANSSPPFAPDRDRFYSYKNTILEKNAFLVGHDIQHIRKMCWKCAGTGIYQLGDSCWSCSKGIYSEFYVRLEKYSFCGYIFHKPVHRQYFPYENPVTIDGYIRKECHWAYHEAWLWLLLIYSDSWKDFWGVFKSSCTFSCYPLPLTKLQRIIWWFRKDFPTPFRCQQRVDRLSSRVRDWLHGPLSPVEPDYDDSPF
jgi:hypothetical protein